MTGFSNRPQDVATARAFLIGAAQRVPPNLPTYGEMAATYGGIARAAGPVLNSIKRDCDIAHEPDLSALVVDRASGLPGMFRGQPVEAHGETNARWRDELERIRSWDWASMPAAGRATIRSAS